MPEFKERWDNHMEYEDLQYSKLYMLDLSPVAKYKTPMTAKIALRKWIVGLKEFEHEIILQNYYFRMEISKKYRIHLHGLIIINKHCKWKFLHNLDKISEAFTYSFNRIKDYRVRWEYMHKQKDTLEEELPDFDGLIASRKEFVDTCYNWYEDSLNGITDNIPLAT